MQKIINGIAILSGVISLTVVGSGVVIYLQKDAIIDSVKEKALGSLGGGALGGVTDMVPDMGSPESPAIPPVGLGIPNF